MQGWQRGSPVKQAPEAQGWSMFSVLDLCEIRERPFEIWLVDRRAHFSVSATQRTKPACFQYPWLMQQYPKFVHSFEQERETEPWEKGIESGRTLRGPSHRSQPEQ
jgi:hypothetical protein